jgi:hypothetical protein
MVERNAAWISGGMSGSASLIATWLKPQLKQSAIVSAVATPSSGREAGPTSCFMLDRKRIASSE